VWIPTQSKLEQRRALRCMLSHENVRVESDAYCRIKYDSPTRRFVNARKIAIFVTESEGKGVWEVVSVGLSRTDSVCGGSRFLRTFALSM
jgi:hypothetical protein